MLKACLLEGQAEQVDGAINLDALDDGAWMALRAQADANAARALDVMADHQHKLNLLKDADHLVRPKGSTSIQPGLGLVKIAVALFYGKILAPVGKAAAHAPWFSRGSESRKAELELAAVLCAELLVDPTHRVRACAVASLKIAAKSQPGAVGRAFMPILAPLSHSAAAVRRDGIDALRACMLPCHSAVLPKTNMALQLTQLMVDDDIEVQSAARALLTDMVEDNAKAREGFDKDGSELKRRDHMLTGLSKGWFPDEIDLYASTGTPRDAGAASMASSLQAGERREDEIDPRSVLLMLASRPAPTARGGAALSRPVTVEQHFHTRAFVARCMPHGCPPAVRAALSLMESAGGESPEEEGDDLRAVEAGVAALSLLGPMRGPSFPGQKYEGRLVGEAGEWAGARHGTVASVCERLWDGDTPLSHVPLLGSALVSFAEASHLGTSLSAFPGAWWRSAGSARGPDPQQATRTGWFVCVWVWVCVCVCVCV